MMVFLLQVFDRVTIGSFFSSVSDFLLFETVADRCSVSDKVKVSTLVSDVIRFDIRIDSVRL